MTLIISDDVIFAEDIARNQMSVGDKSGEPEILQGELGSPKQAGGSCV